MNESGQGSGASPASAIMALLGTVFLTYRRQRQQMVSPAGASLKHFYVLRQLERSGTLRPSDIARMLYCDRPTATVVIGTMVKHGWVSRERDPQNGKQILVKATPEGLRKLAEMQVLSDQQDQSDPLEGLDEEEIAQLRRSLAKIGRNLSEKPSQRE